QGKNSVNACREPYEPATMFPKISKPRGRAPRPRLISRIVFLSIFFSGLSQAADGSEAEADLLDLPLEELLKVEIPDVYGASKHTQKTTEAPSSVSVVTAREIKQFGYKSLGDIMASVRGFYVTKNRYYEFLGVRGFSRPGDYNSRVLVLIDGLRTNDGVFGGTFLDGALPIDVDLIDRIEMIRGPGSSLYGTGAFFAVINIIPKRGRDIEGVELAGEYGSWDSMRGRVTAGKKTQSGFEGLVSATGFKTQGTPQVVFPELAGDPSRNYGVMENTQAVRWRNVRADLEYKDFRLSYSESSRHNKYGTGIYATIFNMPSDNYDSEQLVDLQFNHALNANDSIVARLATSKYDYNATSAYDYPPLTYNHDFARYNAVMGEFSYSARIGEQHRLILGAEYADHTQADQGNYDVSPYMVYSDPRNSFATWALYAQDEIALSKKVTLNLGARYDKSYNKLSSFNPRVGLIIAPKEGTAIKLLYGSAFRAPNAWELYYEAPAVGQKAPAGLAPEKIRTYELVLEQRVTPQLIATGSLYHYRLKNLISFVTDPTDGLFTFANTDSVKTNGLDLELQGKWSRLEGRMSYSYQEAKNAQTGRILSNSPRNLAKLNLIVPLWSERLSAGFEAQHVSKRRNESSDGSSEDVPGYTLANLTLLHRGAVKGLEVSAGVKNLFGARYGDPTSLDDMPEISAIPQDGRTYWIKLSYTFQ
ncbi:MAG: TonB-dependent receptor plug domain-containing protein, partial [Burkholderiales bacterium]